MLVFSLKLPPVNANGYFAAHRSFLLGMSILTAVFMGGCVRQFVLQSQAAIECVAPEARFTIRPLSLSASSRPTVFVIISNPNDFGIGFLTSDVRKWTFGLETVDGESVFETYRSVNWDETSEYLYDIIIPAHSSQTFSVHGYPEYRIWDGVRINETLVFTSRRRLRVCNVSSGEWSVASGPLQPDREGPLGQGRRE